MTIAVEFAVITLSVAFYAGEVVIFTGTIEFGVITVKFLIGVVTITFGSIETLVEFTFVAFNVLIIIGIVAFKEVL